MRRSTLSLRQILIVGTGIGILLPALSLAFFQFSAKFEHEVTLRIRNPMQQYVDVLSNGIAVSLWNVDNKGANDLVKAVMRNPDVVSVTVNNERGENFLAQRNPAAPAGTPLQETRTIRYNDAKIGEVTLEMTTVHVEREFWGQLARLGASLLAQVGFSIIFIWFLFEGRIVRPLRTLQEVALRLARGELDKPLQWQRQDEIGSLAFGLDSMRADLAALIDERDQKNTSLQNELSARQRIELALKLSQAKFITIFDASPVAMTVSRMDGIYDILDANAAWCRLFGRSRETTLGTNGRNNGMWNSQQDRQTMLDSLVCDGSVSHFQAWMHASDRQAGIFCEISGKVIKLDNEALLILSYEDITRKHQYETDILALNSGLEQRVLERTRELSATLEHLTLAQAELVRAEKMSALGSLVAGISHELNTPIGTSLTVASTLQDHATKFIRDMESKSLTRSRLEEFINNSLNGTDIMIRSLRHAAELITSFKQVAVDQTSENRRRFNLNDTVGEIMLTLGPGIRKTAHKVSYDIAADIIMESYPGSLGQILTNLINNALLHAFEGIPQGEIKIDARLQDDDTVLFMVSDNGTGIPEANQGRVFDPFFTTKLGQGGSGLGLHIIYNLVNKTLRGNIRLDSTASHGSRFIFTLPRITPAHGPQ